MGLPLVSYDIERLRSNLLALLPPTAHTSRSEIDALCDLAVAGLSGSRVYTETCPHCGRVQYFQAEPPHGRSD